MPRKPRAPLIIVVEPDQFLGSIVKEKLELEGYAAEVVPTSKRLFTLLSRKEAKGIVLEMSVGAVSVLQELRKEAKYALLPVIVTSVYASREDIETAMGAGANGFVVTTQTTPTEFIKTLTRFFEK